MVSIITSGALGTSIQTGEIDAGAVTTAKIADSNVTFAKLGTDCPTWELLETLTFSGDSTKTSGTLTAKTKYKLVIQLTANTDAGYVDLKINGLGTNIYDFNYIVNVTPSIASNQSSCTLWYKKTTEQFISEVLVGGLSPSIANGEVTIAMNACGLLAIASPERLTLGGRVNLGNGTQITDFTILATTGTLTGTVQILGSD